MIYSNRRWTEFVLSLVTVMFVAWAAPSIAAKPREITVAEGEALLRSALPRESVRAPGFGIEGGPKENLPRFYVYVAMWRGWWKDPSEDGSAIVGWYEVDRKTGDVWSYVICQEETSPGLEALKKKIHKKIGLSEADYKRLRIQGSMCEE